MSWRRPTAYPTCPIAGKVCMTQRMGNSVLAAWASFCLLHQFRHQQQFCEDHGLLVFGLHELFNTIVVRQKKHDLRQPVSVPQLLYQRRDCV